MTPTTRLCAVFLAIGCALGLGAGRAGSAPVAYVDRYFPASARFHVTRAGRPAPRLKGAANLEPGDQLFVDTPGAVVTVRYIANNTLVTATHDGGALTVAASPLPGLTGIVLSWLEAELSGADQGARGMTTAATRAIPTGACFNETGRTNDPLSFDIPVLSAEKSQIGAGERALFVSWRGGAPPYAVTLAEVDTGKTLAEVRGVSGGCTARLPSTQLDPGRYRLTVTDANQAREEEDSLFVVKSAPPMPQPLRDAQISSEARTLYYATWLSAIDGGAWALEAEQVVAGMDCHSAAVQDRLRRWGGAGDCR